MTKKRTSKFKQGIFKPRNPDKYTGSHPILYRSSYELQTMRWLDSNNNVLSWGSESVVIPYQNPLTGKVSRYFVDLNFTAKTNTGELKKYLIEVKPSAQLSPPPPQKKFTKSLIRRRSEYIKNRAKWQAAEQWCAKKGYQFMFITEKNLGK
jgi:hypothetical protein